jgi:hypothetical protein
MLFDISKEPEEPVLIMCSREARVRAVDRRQL